MNAQFLNIKKSLDHDLCCRGLNSLHLVRQIDSASDVADGFDLRLINDVFAC